MKKLLNVLMLMVMFVSPPFWIIIYMSYDTWRDYKRNKYDVPNSFILFLYQTNFNSTFTEA